jgi:hypothetical protein
MNDTPPTLADKLNAATSFRGAAIAIVIAVLTTANGDKILERVWPTKTKEQVEMAQNIAMIRETLTAIQWSLFRQFGITTNGTTQ